MMLARQPITPTIHSTVFKAANCNEPQTSSSDRAHALMERWLARENEVRELVRDVRRAEVAREQRASG